MYNKKRCRSKSIDDRRNLRWENKLIELKTILSELRFTIATAKSRNRWKCRVAAHTSPTTPTYAHHLFTDCNVGDIFQTGKNKSKRLTIFFFFGKQFWDLTQKKKKKQIENIQIKWLARRPWTIHFLISSMCRSRYPGLLLLSCIRQYFYAPGARVYIYGRFTCCLIVLYPVLRKTARRIDGR